MRIKSPVGEYDYRITGLRLRGARIEVDGSLGMWETTMVLGPRDWAPLAGALGVIALGAAALGRRGRPAG
jgi:hypothetical protein